jgi:hypothetical protein
VTEKDSMPITIFNKERPGMITIEHSNMNSNLLMGPRNREISLNGARRKLHNDTTYQQGNGHFTPCATL